MYLSGESKSSHRKIGERTEKRGKKVYQEGEKITAEVVAQKPGPGRDTLGTDAKGIQPAWKQEVVETLRKPHDAFSTVHASLCLGVIIGVR